MCVDMMGPVQLYFTGSSHLASQYEDDHMPKT